MSTGLTWLLGALKENPGISNSEIKAAAAAAGVKVYPALILKAKREAGVPIAARGRKETAVIAGGDVAAKPRAAKSKSASALPVQPVSTIEQVVEVMALSQKLGGLGVVQQALDALKKAGVA